jgi:hypothetical protein
MATSKKKSILTRKSTQAKSTATRPKRGVAGRQRNQSSMSRETFVRPLLAAQVPKASFHVSSSTMNIPKMGVAEVLDVVGIEIHGEVYTTNETFVPLSVKINPQDSELFPRLAGIALPFDRWKCVEVGLHYSTAAPATRAGTIGGCVQFDPLDPDPPDMTRLGQYESFFLGPVSASMDCVGVWPESDPWFLTSATEDPNSEEDPNWRYPGKVLLLTNDAGGDDEDKVAGFIAISYHFRLARLKPLSNLLFDGNIEGMSVTDVVNTQKLALNPPVTVLGYWDWFVSNVTAFTAATLGAVKFVQQARATAGEYYAGLNLTLTAPASSLDVMSSKVKSGPTILANYVNDPRSRAPILPRAPLFEGKAEGESELVTVLTWCNPNFHPTEEGRRELRKKRNAFSHRSVHLCRKGKDDEKTLVVWDGKKPPELPLAAGDVSVGLIAVRIDTLEESAVLTSVQNSAGAFELRVADNFSITFPSYLVWRINTATGQTRTISEGRFGYGLVESHS